MILMVVRVIIWHISQKFENVFSSLSETVEDLNNQFEEEEEEEDKEASDDIMKVENKLTEVINFYILQDIPLISDEDFAFGTSKKRVQEKRGYKGNI